MKLIQVWLCKQADKEHEENKRQYAHTFHRRNTICVARAFQELPLRHQKAILLHEYGHLIAGQNGSEADANRAIEEFTGRKIFYVDSVYGDGLETL